jgi:hypothetical protein
MLCARLKFSGQYIRTNCWRLPQIKRIRAKEDAGIELTSGQASQIDKCEQRIRDLEAEMLPQVSPLLP